MTHAISIVILTIALAYALIGLLVGAWFVFRGIVRVDPGAQNATIGFRLVIWPGASVLWPWVIARVRKGEPSASGLAVRGLLHLHRWSWFVVTPIVAALLILGVLAHTHAADALGPAVQAGKTGASR